MSTAQAQEGYARYATGGLDQDVQHQKDRAGTIPGNDAWTASQEHRMPTLSAQREAAQIQNNPRHYFTGKDLLRDSYGKNAWYQLPDYFLQCNVAR